jgi:hypothetical protein
MAKITTVLEHSDTVSGTYILDDGTKCYWSEGRSSEIICELPDGGCTEFPVCGIEDLRLDAPELVDCLADAMENGVDAEYRAMTPNEEVEHQAARS